MCGDGSVPGWLCDCGGGGGPLAVVAIRYNPDAAAWLLALFRPSLRPTKAT